MTMRKMIHLGFEVGTGKRVEIPLAHTFVTGQTQLSGKTTTLRAIVERSHRPALAFITKRGESFDGRRIRPYLPQENNRPLHWRLVEAIMAGALGQKNMKWERAQIVTVTKGATSLEQVRRNITTAMNKARGDRADIYMLLGEYLDLILPGMRALNAADELDLQNGLNVMDLGGIDVQLQALVIRAALEWINLHGKGILTVFPEAWEFAPRGRTATAKEEAIAMARKGAVLGNFLLCDSQDIAGVDTVVRGAASVWILGVQRELNELKRTLQMIDPGIKKPKPEDISRLKIGEFFACCGGTPIKTYVQPAWMSEEEAISIARGGAIQSSPPQPKGEPTVTDSEAKRLREENAEFRATIKGLRERINALEGKEIAERLIPSSVREAADSKPAKTFTSAETIDNEVLYQAIVTRLIEEAPAIIRVLREVPEIDVKDSVKVIEVDSRSGKGIAALMILDGFFDEGGATSSQARTEIMRRGLPIGPNVGASICDELAGLGFLTKEANGRYKVVPAMRNRVKQKDI